MTEIENNGINHVNQDEQGIKIEANEINDDDVKQENVYDENDDIVDDDDRNAKIIKNSKRKNSNLVGMNDDGNELDYDDDDDDNESEFKSKKQETNKKKSSKDEDEGEVEASGSEDGELQSPKRDDEITDNAKTDPVDVEEGEIDDGEKAKKTFIPKKLCKFYQRGKCTWGRTCKFLHPGVNDTGNYNFLEVEDPTTKFLSNKMPSEIGDTKDDKGWTDGRPNPVSFYAPTPVESSWERGLKYAKEMKEKALQRKQAEKDFQEKKMNLSLKDIEDEKENDEQHIYVERPPRNDLEDDEIPLEERLEFGRIKREQKSQNNTTTHPIDRRIPADTRNTDRFDRNKRNRGESPPGAKAARGGDEWHDYWDRGRQPQKRPLQKRSSRSTSRGRRASSYSRSSSSSSRSSRSSRSSYSSQSRSSVSRSTSRSSYSSRSVSRSPTPVKKKIEGPPQKKGPGQAVNKAAPVTKTTAKEAPKAKQAQTTTTTNKPGKQVTETAVKKTAVSAPVADTTKTKKKSENERKKASSYSSSDDDDHSRSSSLSYSSRSSQASNLSGSSQNYSDSASSYSSSDSEDNKPKQKAIKGANVKKPKTTLSSKEAAKEDLKKLLSAKTGGVKRQASEKTAQDAKKQKITSSEGNDKKEKGESPTKAKPKDKEKLQMIKEELRLVGSALNKKKTMTK